MKPILVTIFTLALTSLAMAQTSSIRLIDSVSLFFRYNDYLVINAESLSQKLQTYKNEEGIAFKINGYSDTLGQTLYNQYLSEKRNEKTRSYIGEFLPNANVQDVAYGEINKYNRFKAATARRVDIFVYQHDKPAEEVKLFNPKVTQSVVIDSVQKKKTVRIQPGKKQILTIMFVPDEAIILPESFSEVESLYKTLVSLDEYKIELHGHVCCFNEKKLSKRRAKTIKQLLIAKGIDKKRIKIYGHGNSQPITEERTESEKAENRRVEVLFIPMKPRK